MIMKKYKYHYTYRITNLKLNKHYYVYLQEYLYSLKVGDTVWYKQNEFTIHNKENCNARSLSIRPVFSMGFMPC